MKLYQKVGVDLWHELAKVIQNMLCNESEEISYQNPLNTLSDKSIKKKMHKLLRLINMSSLLKHYLKLK